MKNKKGDVSVLRIIMAAVVILIVAVIVITIFRNLVGKEAGTIKQEIEFGLGNSDNDQVSNKFDACLCVDGEVDNDGCPYNVKPQMGNVSTRFLKCSENFCEKYGIEGCPDNPKRK